MKHIKLNFFTVLILIVWQILYAANVQACEIINNDSIAQKNPLQISEIQFHLLEFLSPHEIRQIGSTNRNWRATVNDYKIIRGPLKAKFNDAITNHGFSIEKVSRRYFYKHSNIDDMGSFFNTKPIREKYFFDISINIICTCQSANGLKYGGYLERHNTYYPEFYPAIFNNTDTLDDYRLIFPKKDNINGWIFDLSHDGKIAIGAIDKFNKTLNYDQPFIWDEHKGLTFLYNPNGDINSRFWYMSSNGEIVGGFVGVTKSESRYSGSISACLWIGGQHYLLKDVVSQGFTAQQQKLVRGYELRNIECISPDGRYLVALGFNKSIDKLRYFKIHF